MWVRIIMLALFAAGIAGLYVYFEHQDKLPAASIAASASEARLKEQGQQRDEEWWAKKEQPLESRLTFRKKWTVVHVGELNTDLVYGKKLGDLSERDVSLNPDTAAMYFYRQELLPDQEDRLAVIHDVNSMDRFVSQQVSWTSQDRIQLDFPEFNQPDAQSNPDYGYLNEARLYGGIPMKVTLEDEEGTILIEFDGQSKRLKPGERASFVKSKEISSVKVRSKVVVSNYGLWDSSQVKYIVSGEGAQG